MDAPAAVSIPGLDPELLEECVHCGLCLETCPTFLETGREAESPRGRLLLARGLATGRWTADPTLLGHLDRCLGCRACESVCPAGVQYGTILEGVRAATRDRRANPRNRFETFLVRHVFWRGPLLEKLTALGYRWTHVWSLARLAAGFPGIPASVAARLRLLPRAEGRGTPRVQDGEGPAVLLLRGCVARALYPRTEAAMVDLLRSAGYAVELLDRPECCGALASHAGERDLARRLGEKLFEVVSGGDAPIVTTAAGCGAHLKGISHVFADTLDDTGAERLQSRVLDLTEALVWAPRPPQFAGEPIPVVYQDACHLRHGQGITQEPRDLLRAAGADLVEAEESELCCGSAGTYNIGEADMAERLGRRKAEALRRTGARVVVTANPGCAIQLQAHLHRAGDPEVVTLPRFLADRLAQAEDAPE